MYYGFILSIATYNICIYVYNQVVFIYFLNILPLESIFLNILKNKFNQEVDEFFIWKIVWCFEFTNLIEILINRSCHFSFKFGSLVFLPIELKIPLFSKIKYFCTFAKSMLFWSIVLPIQSNNNLVVIIIIFDNIHNLCLVKVYWKIFFTRLTYTY